jgi:hypothetical protein
MGPGEMVPVDCKADEEAGSHAKIPNSKRTPNKNSAANMPSELYVYAAVKS